MGEIRTFDTGATRDSDENKIDFEGFLSPLVLERYAEYMHENRIQSDGTLRGSDNWQSLFGEDHCSVCIKSLFRHFMDLWKAHRGHKTDSDIETILCAIMFNTMAYAHKIINEKKDKESDVFYHFDELDIVEESEYRKAEPNGITKSKIDDSTKQAELRDVQDKRVPRYGGDL